MDLGGNSRQNGESPNEQANSDMHMPAANVRRIMRTFLSEEATIDDDAIEAVRECVSEFIGFITSEANDRAQAELRKTVKAEDLLVAMSRLGFDNYVQPLAIYLNNYRENEARLTSVRGEPSVVRRVDFAPPQAQRQRQLQPRMMPVAYPPAGFQLVAPRPMLPAARNPPVVPPRHMHPAARNPPVVPPRPMRPAARNPPVVSLRQMRRAARNPPVVPGHGDGAESSGSNGFDNSGNQK